MCSIWVYFLHEITLFYMIVSGRSELMMIIQKFRSNSGSLNSMVMQDVVSGVTQLILDQQEVGLTFIPTSIGSHSV